MHFFSGYSDENTVWKSADDKDFRETGITESPIELVFHAGEWDFPTIQTQIGDSYSLDTNVELKIEKSQRRIPGILSPA